ALGIIREARFPALVAQWIEQEFPKLCAGSSILPGGVSSTAAVLFLTERSHSWSSASASKADVVARSPWVRIPPSPPFLPRLKASFEHAENQPSRSRRVPSEPP